MTKAKQTDTARDMMYSAICRIRTARTKEQFDYTDARYVIVRQTILKLGILTPEEMRDKWDIEQWEAYSNKETELKEKERATIQYAADDNSYEAYAGMRFDDMMETMKRER